jgi:hypothetical protein
VPRQHDRRREKIPAFAKRRRVIVGAAQPGKPMQAKGFQIAAELLKVESRSHGESLWMIPP